MEEKNEITFKNPVRKLFGGLNMSWPAVIIFAAVSAVLTALFLIVPFLANTSLNRMGVTFEAWIFFAVIIMSNCKKPLESALKTFVFFLISQPLIYLLQIPFSDMGWGLFMYYRYWGIITIFTFPAAFAGWFITKRNWLSVLILSPVLAYLGLIVYETGKQCIESFPKGLIALLFCIAQIVLYIIAFMPRVPMKIVGGLIPALALVFVIIMHVMSPLNYTILDQLPDETAYSENAVITVSDSSVAEVFPADHENGYVRLEVHKIGTTDFTVSDGGKEYVYRLDISEEGNSVSAEITPVN